ncbi:MAG: bifunctional diaminohydroxyphosphoribosylaminopyrimidine deaminase/5-amino-6-(5-phosphoribosylamino)uracil reductase RibD [Ignavibacteriaceae bacterium]
MADESYIQLTLEIAKRGIGKVSPNPLVGCVITKNNKIIGAGFHAKYGDDHAEINAIKSSHENLEGSTLYVNLEPCSHSGKTPPCVDRIIAERIKKVVIGTKDPNPLVSGEGIRKLKQSGIEVTTGVLEKECSELNKFFFKYITLGIPYITLKAATTLDGKIADANSESEWISCTESQRHVHKLRNIYDAVLIGTQTAVIDDPQLTVRHVEGRNPYRIVLDSRLKLRTDLNIFRNNHDSRTIVVTSKTGEHKKRKIAELKKLGINIIVVKKNHNDKIHLKSMLKTLGKLHITSVLVEGGSRIYTSFIKQKLFDDMILFLSPKFIGGGIPIVNNLGVKSIKSPFKLKLVNCEAIGEDIVAEYIPL